MNRIPSFMLAKIIHLHHDHEHLFLFYDDHQHLPIWWSPVWSSSRVERVTSFSLPFHCSAYQLHLKAPLSSSHFHHGSCHHHHLQLDQLTMIIMMTFARFACIDLIIGINKTWSVLYIYCLFSQILFCFLSQIFEIRSVCIDLRV